MYKVAAKVTRRATPRNVCCVPSGLGLGIVKNDTIQFDLTL